MFFDDISVCSANWCCHNLTNFAFWCIALRWFNVKSPVLCWWRKYYYSIHWYTYANTGYVMFPWRLFRIGKIINMDSSCLLITDHQRQKKAHSIFVFFILHQNPLISMCILYKLNVCHYVARGWVASVNVSTHAYSWSSSWLRRPMASSVRLMESHDGRW